MQILKPLYDHVMSWAEHRHAPYILFFVAFIESIFFPIPPDLILIGLVLARPKWAWLDATLCTLGSVLGGITAYMIGRYLFEGGAEAILQWVCQFDAKYCPDLFLPALKHKFDELGIGLVLMGSLSVFPYKLITIGAGLMEMDLTQFIGASILGRGARFFILATLLWKFGAPIRDFVEKHLVTVFTIFCIVVFLLLYLRLG